jgi:cysteine desulfurase
MGLIYQSGLDFIRNGSEHHLPGLISLSFKNQDGEKLLHRLDLVGISVSTGAACDSVNTQISHVLKAISVPDDYARGTIRVSLGKNNTEEEVDRIANSIIKICAE